MRSAFGNLSDSRHAASQKLILQIHLLELAVAYVNGQHADRLADLAAVTDKV
jgi:hypothetical protein